MAASFLTHPAVPRVVPFALYMVFLALKGSVPDSVDVRWLYPLQVGLVALALAVFWRRYTEWESIGTLGVRDWLWAIAVGVIVFVLWINLDAGWMTVEGLKASLFGAPDPAAVTDKPAPGFDPRDDGQINLWLASSRLLGAAVVVPVMEELFWRSFVMRWIDNPNFLAQSARATTFKALLLSSVVFGLEHDLWFAGIVAGLAYGGLYRITGKLWVPILAHGVTNGVLGGWVLYTGAWSFW
ncbi:MAG: CAAX prenyl protease-related protein [Burkholderiales bacterium]|nr:CAAX prenyl protease-related protein [Burkholderiales bacterium]